MKLVELLLRLAGLFMIFELLVLSFNPLPETRKQWRSKKLNVLRRVFYYAACLLAAVWLATL
jgi:hypothetical protein